MGNFLDDLKTARYAPVAIRQRFRIEYDEAREDAYAFFESTDDGTFYRKQIFQYLPSAGRLRIYYCGNKRSVWYHYEFAEQERKLKNTLFFVDKDLDDFTGHALPCRSRVFVTDLYAVENYLCTEETLTSVLEELIFLPDEQNRHSRILKEFTDGFNDIASQLRPLFAEIILLRQLNANISFSDFGDSLSPCFEMVELKPGPVSDWDKIFRTRCKYDPSSLSSADIREKADWLAEKPHHEWMRGKFALWFFLRFVGELWGSLVGELINDRKKIKKTVDMQSDNVFLIMQGRHPLPRGLEQFITNNICQDQNSMSVQF
ncbi:DUF4435 domain-containing protein [Granulicella sp. L60]|uniref:DUF4435 domain-containing protein n=1 Tax=Granulicella sp. L60 TaxID=1641866 RepID=UPI00131A9429|nr:DUF4435 domain-containing protein [Granulicella sp. L60]